MKKTLYYILTLSIILTLHGCQDQWEETLNSPEPQQPEEILTRATEIAGRPDFIQQIEGMPVRIFIPPGIMTGIPDTTYVAAMHKGAMGPGFNKVGFVNLMPLGAEDLFDYEWFISWNSTYNAYRILSSGNGAMLSNHSVSFDDTAIMADYDIRAYNAHRWFFHKAENVGYEDKFHITEHSSSSFNQTLQTEGYSPMMESTSRPADPFFYSWGIMPIEEFEIVEMSYSLGSTDVFRGVPERVNIQTVNNLLNTPVQRTITISETIRNQSTFSRMQGGSVSLTTSAGFSIETPKIGSFNIDVSSTTNDNWSFTNGSTEEQTLAITESLQIPMEAHSAVTVQIVAFVYEIDIPYEARLRSKYSMREVTLTGRWNAVIAKEYDIQIKYPNTAPISYLTKQPPKTQFMLPEDHYCQICGTNPCKKLKVSWKCSDCGNIIRSGHPYYCCGKQMEKMTFITDPNYPVISDTFVIVKPIIRP